MLNPCDFETQNCRDESFKNDELVANCTCKVGYEEKVDKLCVQSTHDSFCDLEQNCGVGSSKDPNMKCIQAPYGLNMCVCPKGFKKEGNSVYLY